METFDPILLHSFLVESFIKGKLNLQLFEEVLFSSKSLDEKEYLDFATKPPVLSLAEAREKFPEFLEFEKCLKKLFQLVQYEVYSADQVLNVIFKDYFFERKKIE